MTTEQATTRRAAPLCTGYHPDVGRRHIETDLYVFTADDLVSLLGHVRAFVTKLDYQRDVIDLTVSWLDGTRCLCYLHCRRPVPEPGEEGP